MTHIRYIDRAGRAYDGAILARLTAWMFLITLFVLPMITDIRGLLTETPAFAAVPALALALPLVLASCWSEHIWARLTLGAAAVAIAGVLIVDVYLVLPLTSVFGTPEDDVAEPLVSLVANASAWLAIAVWIIIGFEVVRAFVRLVLLDQSSAEIVREPRGVIALLGVPPGLRYMAQSKIATFAKFVLSSLFMIFPLLVISLSLPMVLLMGGQWLRSGAESGFQGDPYILYEAMAACILLLLAYKLRRSAEQQCISSASDAMKSDRRRPILFLRAFKDDRVEFARPRLMPLRYLLSILSPRTTLDSLLVREFASYGPVVAIGNPQEQLPLFGVFRDFHDDATWRTAVSLIAREAVAIVVAVDETEGLGWELQLIAERGYRDKTLLIAPDRFKALERNGKLWSIVSARLQWNVLGDGEPPSNAVLAAFQNEGGEPCVATSRRFTTSDYHMTLRWYFRQRCGEGTRAISI